MRKRWNYLIALFTIAFCLVIGASGAFAAEEPLSDLYYLASTSTDSDTAVALQTVEGEQYLFLPSSADFENLTLYFEAETAVISSDTESAIISSGTPFDFSVLFDEAPADKVYTVTLVSGENKITVHVMRSANLRSMYITSANAEKDREWVEQDKENKAKDNPMVLLRADGSCVYDGELKNIKGRGNSTWNAPKKPYQIKLDEATDLLETGDPNEVETTWVLLANYYDDTLIHNSVTYNLAAEFGLDYSPNCEMLDLYYDGEYRGTYLLSEKTEIGTGRVNIANLEAEIEDCNSTIEDFDELPTAVGTNSYGNSYQYVTGLTTPKDISGGYLLELDFEDRAKAEKSWFQTSNGKYVVSKSPEYLSADAMEYISGFYQEFEDAVYNGGVNPTTGKSYTDYVDLESLAKCYLIQELSRNEDAFQTSTYFYKPEDEERLYAGPVWDFDAAYGSYAETADDQSLVAGQTKLGQKLLSIPGFRAAVQRYYSEELYDLVSEIVLSNSYEASGRYLRSILNYATECMDSWQMNRVLWSELRTGGNDYTACITAFQDFISARNEWLYSEVMSWDENTTFPIRFIDVPKDAWYYDAVNYVVERGLFNGTSELRFSPENVMTRAMAVTVLHRLDGNPSVGDNDTFSDVDGNSWYGEAVAWAVENGIVNGYPDGTFQPERKVTREELVTIFYRYAEYAEADTMAPEIPNSYVDGATVSDWAREAFGWAIANELIHGTDSTTPTLSPKGTAVRCQAAAIFQRYNEFIATSK
ncbi:MAG: CotH kinase family protein [Oscillospiraceae bacterium]|jgi:hypothetical protein